MSFRLNPLTGNLDLIAEAAPTESVDLTRVCGQDVSALKLLVSDTDGRVIYAEPNTTFEQSQVLGISLTAAVENDNILVRTFGLVQAAFFTYAAGTDLFLSASGAISDTPPSVGFRVLVGKSLGVGEIFIDVRETVVLEA